MHRPTLINFLVLAREASQSELESGSLRRPICHATWDFPDPDTFYEALDQVVSVLDPIHRRPGALITAAAAPEALGLYIIQIKNEFGHSLDFVRRAIRGATQGRTILETFPLDAFLQPVAIHTPQRWSRGMRRYESKHTFKHNPVPVFLYSLRYLKASIHEQCQRCPLQPPSPVADDRGRTSVRAARADGLRSRNGTKDKLSHEPHYMFSNFNIPIKSFYHFKIIILLITPLTTPSKPRLVLGSILSISTQNSDSEVKPQEAGPLAKQQGRRKWEATPRSKDYVVVTIHKSHSLNNLYKSLPPHQAHRTTTTAATT